MELNLDRRLVMSIVNVTPDSFYDGCRSMDLAEVEHRVRTAVDEGANILDIGGYSSRPGADVVSVEEEIRRVALGVEAARRVSSELPVSIDTFRAEVVESIVQNYGEVMVNDISAGELDESMIATVAKYNLPYVAMHMRGRPETMQSCTVYDDVTRDVVEYLTARAEQLKDRGVKRVVLDPGFGFAKTLSQNYALLNGLSDLVAVGYPVLVGVSRKSMIYKALDISQQEALTGTIALHWECLRAGARILRVHDTREAVQTIKLFETYESNR
jgi:dihydropteroate synthase